MNGHNSEVLEHLDAPVPDEEEWEDIYTLVSDCCGVPLAYGIEEAAICGQCGEHCEYEKE